jgi:hypothetical protein
MNPIMRYGVRFSRACELLMEVGLLRGLPPKMEAGFLGGPPPISILGGGYFLTTSVNRFYEAGKYDRFGK